MKYLSRRPGSSPPAALRRRVAVALTAGLAAAAIFFGLSWLLIPQPPVEDFAVSPALMDREGRLFHVRLSADDEWLLPRPLDSLSPWLKLAAVTIEDQRFYRHPGVDLLALLRAAAQNIQRRRVVSGASTIAAQLARLAEPKPRTIWNKYREFIGALKLTRNFSRERLLELYLNRAPLGGNLRGVQAGALHYFNKSAADLSLGESALLAALWRAPTLYRPDRAPELARRRRDLVLDLMARRGAITPAQAAAARAEPVTAPRGRLPRRAWHFAEAALKAAGGPETWRWARSDRAGGLTASLDLDLQGALESRLNLTLAELPDRLTAAGAIMDNETGEILAYVGHARRRDNEAGHWVDCARAPRSSGSTLKPFVYLTAFASRLLNPASLLADTPLALNGQAPRNFDRRYRGPVNARTALAESLNAPAVRVLRLAGRAKALTDLRRLGFSYLKPDPNHYGDSLVLGGGEVNLRQLLAAYGALARQGLRVKPVFFKTEARSKEPGAAPPPDRLFEAGPAWLINACLKIDGQRPDLRDLAFKTGTTHGFRDAWLAAWSPGHTLVLWAGDPAGRGYPGLTGLKTLGPATWPLMAELARRRPPTSAARQRWRKPPDQVENFQACALSGRPAGPHCPAIRQAFRLKEGAPGRACRLHQRENGQVVRCWPPDLAEFMAAARLERRPAIIAPRPGSVLALAPGAGALRVPLRVEGARGRLYWFVDDQFYRSSGPGQNLLVELGPGRHRLALVDEAGAAAGAEVEVRRLRPPAGETPRLSFRPAASRQ